MASSYSASSRGEWVSSGGSARPSSPSRWGASVTVHVSHPSTRWAATARARSAERRFQTNSSSSAKVG